MKKLITTFTLLCSLLASAQTTPNYNTTDKRYNSVRNSFWFEANLMGTLARYKDSSAKWQYQLDIQYRRMADANYVKGGNKADIFKDPFQHVYRPWVHYWVKPNAIRLSLSPIGYWATWTPTGEGQQQFYGEYRICPQITFFQKIGRLEIQQRYRYEFRFISTKDAAGTKSEVADYALGTDYLPSGEKQRMRYMIRLNYSLNGKSSGTKGSTYFTVWNEVFIGIGANTVNSKILDQNRLVIMFGRYLKTNYPLKIELGYTLQYKPNYDITQAAGQTAGAYTYNKLNWEANNCLQVYLICDDFHKLGFKKKKAAETPIVP
jgi:hypothetical protein